MDIKLRMAMRLVTCVSGNLERGCLSEKVYPSQIDPRDFDQAHELLSEDYRDIAAHATEMLHMFGDDVTVTYDDSAQAAAFVLE